VNWPLIFTRVSSPPTFRSPPTGHHGPRHSKMSLNLNPVSLGVREKFRPFRDAVAYPVTRYLPFGMHARYLSLGGCDIRKILYTIYSEKGNGKRCVKG
jgi:hypothetical protein